MNTSPRFRYYLAFALLTLLGLAVRIQSVAGPESVAGVKHSPEVAQLHARAGSLAQAE